MPPSYGIFKMLRCLNKNRCMTGTCPRSILQTVELTQAHKKGHFKLAAGNNSSTKAYSSIEERYALLMNHSKI